MPTQSPIQFFKEGVTFRLLHTESLKKWIASLFKTNKMKVENLNYIFCSDRYLLDMNKNYLDHNYLTDVITFDNSSEKGKVEADIFISTDRVSANAAEFKTTFNDELHRVMIHGALHLVGYSDKNVKGKKEMRDAEDFWLKKRRLSQK